MGETVEEVHVKNIPLTGSISHYFDVIWKMEKKRARIQRKALQEKTPVRFDFMKQLKDLFRIECPS